jgi:hypothetical protein
MTTQEIGATMIFQRAGEAQPLAAPTVLDFDTELGGNQ